MAADRQVAVVLGSNRIPFARSNGPYAKASNQDMLTAALDGLIERTGIAGERLGEVAGGAVLKHSRDFNLTRESLLGTRIAPQTPAYDVGQACGTGLETAILVANKIALGQVESGIACGVDTTSDAPDRGQRRPARDPAGGELGAFEPRPGPGAHEGAARVTSSPRSPATPSRAPASRWASTPRSWPASGGFRGRRRTSSRPPATGTSAPPTSRASRTTSSPPTWGSSAIRTSAPTRPSSRSAGLKPVFGGTDGTMTAGNSTPLSDGASAVLLGTEDWGRAHGLSPLARFVDAETAAVDHVGAREGLLMAPAYAVPRLLARHGLELEDFDLYEIHEAFAAQVLCTLAAWEDPVFCRERLGLDGALGSIDREKLNVRGGSLAAGHPFAATGGRIVANLAKMLHERGGGRGLISICAAGGQGVVAILEA